MNKSARKQIHRALKSAVPFLHDGKDEGNDWNTEYICVAIDHARRSSKYAWPSYNGASMARSTIESRISPFCSFETWLERQPTVRYADLTFERVQKHRHAWLQQLIKEFSK